jgi:hypothetical protein
MRRYTDGVGSGDKNLFLHIWEKHISTIGRDADYTTIFIVFAVPPGEERNSNSKQATTVFLHRVPHYSSVIEPLMQQSRTHAQHR